MPLCWPVACLEDREWREERQSDFLVLQVRGEERRVLLLHNHFVVATAIGTEEAEELWSACTHVTEVVSNLCFVHRSLILVGQIRGSSGSCI